MEKARKRKIAETIAKNASNEYFTGFVNGYNAAKAEAAKAEQTEQDKKPA